jgi:polyisoprenoid-binding protein YceI
MRLVFASLATAGLCLAACSASLAAAPVKGGVATLSPENTKIQFVCAHSGAKPDPRTGGFAKFTGQAQVDPATKSLKSVTIDIDTTSLFTEIDKLTTHLKSADFFEVRQHPTAKFVSTKITPGSEGKATITGKLTLHGVTKEISFPATALVSDSGLSLTSKFSIDRREFGMDYGQGKVENKVDLTVVVGEKAAAE